MATPALSPCTVANPPETGWNWTRVTSPATRQVFSVAIDEQDGQTWVVATSADSADEPGLWVSNDAGRNWRSAWNGLFSWESVRSTPNAFFATEYRSSGGLLVSRDHGRNWSVALAGTPNQTAFETSAPSRTRPGLLLAARRRVGTARPDSILRSVDDGATWSEVPVDGAVFSLVEDASGTFLGAARGGAASLVRSTDQGASWQSLPTPLGNSISGLLGDPARARFFARVGVGAFVTNNAGQTWSIITGAFSPIIGIGLNSVTGDFFAADVRPGEGSILISEGGTGPFRQVGQAIPGILNVLTTDKCGSILLAGGNSDGSFRLYSSPIPRRP